jgi:hypothetical protein
MAGKTHLLTATQWLLRAATAFALLLITLLVLVLGALALAKAGLLQLPVPAKDLHGVSLDQVLPIAAAIIAAATVCVVLAVWMFVLAARIIDTARGGDPFVADNADRLDRIAWLLLAIQAIGFFADLAGTFIPDNLKDHVSVGLGGFSASGILAVLMIFVLAQIFRHGSAMRAELEGMV